MPLGVLIQHYAIPCQKKKILLYIFSKFSSYHYIKKGIHMYTHNMLKQQNVKEDRLVIFFSQRRKITLKVLSNHKGGTNIKRRYFVAGFHY
jgi:hypothetical protein